MAVSDLDIWRSANEMIKQYGENAWIEAVLKYFEMSDAKDADGIGVWRRIARAIGELSDTTPRPPH